MTQVIERITSKLTETAKIKDLSNDTWDCCAVSGQNVMTTDHGTAIVNPDTWLKVNDGKHGPGPALLEDQIAREKIMRFDHERIPERVVHARGAGAHGYFHLKNPIPEYSFASVLNETSHTTPVFIRFSTVQGSRGSADTVRDVRGFAVKFYTDEGNWDIVGNNIPVFFIQDAIKFPDIIHAVKPEPHNEVPQGQSAHPNFYDFISLQPETTHMLMWVMSDRAIPKSYRMMQGFGVNTYTLINKAGERHFVKFHFTPELGVHSLVWDEALKINGQDPDFHRKDLEAAIMNGAYPRWTFEIQVIPEGDQDNFDFDILDATKIWPEDLVPKIEVGEIVLNRVVDEFFTEVEQIAFCTSHVVPGVSFSDDPLLQGRNFSYFDTQITRLGPNFQELPINRPVCPVMNFNRDGAMRHRISRGKINYWPNRFDVVAPHKFDHAKALEYPQLVPGVKQRYRGPKFDEHFSQAQLFYNSLACHEQQHIINALSFELDKVDETEIVQRMIERLNQVDFELARQVATNVGGEIPKAPGANHKKASKYLSQEAYQPSIPSIKTRKVAILVADGFDLTAYDAIKAGLYSAGAISVTIGCRGSKVMPANGNPVTPDHFLEGARPTLFDALLIPPGEYHVKTLLGSGRAIHYIREGFGHCKPIAGLGEGVEIVRAALPLPELRYAEDPTSEVVVNSYGIVTARKVSLSETKGALDFGKGEIGFLATFASEISKHRNWVRETHGLVARVAF